MPKVVINTCWGGFGLSDQAHREMGYSRDIKRDDPKLVAIVERLGEAANGEFAKLKVVEVPDGVEIEIVEYDGWEHVAEAHRTWS